jgi:hypothetical protein
METKMADKKIERIRRRLQAIARDVGLVMADIDLILADAPPDDGVARHGPAPMTGVKGVSFDRRVQKYNVRIWDGSGTRWIGTYATLDEAKAAYDRAASGAV